MPEVGTAGGSKFDGSHHAWTDHRNPGTDIELALHLRCKLRDVGFRAGPVPPELAAAAEENGVSAVVSPEARVSERPRWNQWSTGTSFLAIATKLASRASDARRS